MQLPKYVFDGLSLQNGEFTQETCRRNTAQVAAKLRLVSIAALVPICDRLPDFSCDPGAQSFEGVEAQLGSVSC